MAKSFESVEKKLETYREENSKFEYDINDNILTVRCISYDIETYFIDLISKYINVFFKVIISTSRLGKLSFLYKNDILYVSITCSSVLTCVKKLSVYFPIFLFNNYTNCLIFTHFYDALYINNCELPDNINVLVNSNFSGLIDRMCGELLHHPNIYIYTGDTYPLLNSDCYPFSIDLWKTVSDEEWAIFLELM